MSGWHCFSFKEGLSYREMPCLKAWPTRGTHTQWLIMTGLKTWCPWLTRGQLQWAMLALGLLVGCTEATSQFQLFLCLIASTSLILQVLIPNKYLHVNPHFRVCFFKIQTDKKWSKTSSQYGGILELHLPITDGIWTTDAQVAVHWGSVQFSRSVMSDSLRPMNHSMPGLPVHHQLPEFTQTHVHWVGDAIQPSHPLSSPSPPALNLSQHQGLFKWISSLHQVAKVLEFQLQHQSFQWPPRTDLL